MPDPTYFVPLLQAIPFFPTNLVSSPNGDNLLDRIGLTDFNVIESIDVTTVELTLAFADEFKAALPGLDGFEFVLGSEGSNELAVEVDVYPEFAFRLVDTTVRFRLQQDLLYPVHQDSNNAWVKNAGPTGEPLPFEISLEGLQFSVNSEGAVGFDLDDSAINVSPFMIADSGIVIEIESLSFHFSDSNPFPNSPPGSRGISVARAAIYLPEGLSVVVPTDVQLENLTIGSNGFSGRVIGSWDPTLKADGSGFEGNGAGNIFDIAFGLQRLGLEFRDSTIIASQIEGTLLIPYFGEPISVSINLGNQGDFSVTLKASNPEGITVSKEELLALNMKSLSVSRTSNNVGALVITGGLEPLLMSSDGMQWPRLDVTDLYLDSTGKFSIKEAWLDLKELATLDLWGFHFELRRIGLGSEQGSGPDGDRLWIDLSGGLRLIEQIPLALDVEGFRLTWPQNLLAGTSSPTLTDIQSALSKISVEFAGIYLFFGVPDAVEFEGLIRFFKEPQIVGFAGDMALRVPASGFGAEAGLLIGLSFEPAFPFLYVYFGVDLPAGIPLGQSGLALKGAQGMFGLNVGPDKDPDQNWYYDWYKRGPIVGAHPTNKWKPFQSALALGVGVTITTTDGYVKGTRGLIVLAIPGPILIIEGRALILNGLTPDAEPPLRALAVFDGGAKTVQFNVEAEATLIADTLKAYGMLEAFFDFNDLTNWHLYLGQDTPRDRRIRADILKLDNKFLFKADAYLMIDMVGTQTLRSRMGASIGFEPDVPDIDPLKVDFAAVLKGDGEVTARPEQFSGELDLSAHIKLSALGVNVRLSAEAGFLTEGPKPLKVGAHVKVEAEMPSPLDPVEATLEFEWHSTDLPKVESPLSEIDVHSRLAPRRAGFIKDAVEDVNKFYNKIHEFADIDQNWEVPAKNSPLVEADSQPIVCFKQKMNSDVNSFARHPNGETHHYDVGLFQFRPRLKTIKLYERLKVEDQSWANDDTDWGKPIASTDEADDKPLPGVWLVESEPESPEAPSPRSVQLWTDNPLSSSARALGPGYKLFRGAIGTGKTVAQRVLEDYPDLMECTHTKPHQVCVSFKVAEEITIERGESWEYKDLLFVSRQKTARLQMVGGFTASTGGIIDAIRSVGSSILDTLLRRPAPHQCLFIDGYIDIHFRQRVKQVRIVFCQPSIMKENDIRVRVTTKRGIRTEGELAASGQDRKTVTLEDIRSCNVSVASDLIVNEDVWILEADEGFDCINIIRMDKFAIREICYTTVAEIERSRLALEECKHNADPTEGQTLRPGAYYRLDVITRVSGELNRDNLPFDPDSFLGEMLLGAYEALNNLPLPKDFHQTCFFQTEAPPTNLRPYVKWVSPQEQSERFFYGDNISIRFLRSNLEAMFRSPFTLTARVKDTQGKLAEGFSVQWRRATNHTLFPEESVWEDHRSGLNWPARPVARDNVLLVQSEAGLVPGSRYTLEVVGTASGPDRSELVVFSSKFTTSKFKSFEDLAGSFQGEQSIDAKPNALSDSTAFNELQISAQSLSRARYDFEHAEIDFRFETLIGGREGLEQARLERRELSATHDAKFSAFAEGLADLYYRPLAERTELYVVTDPRSGSVVALWVRSPESLDVRLGVVGENPDVLQTSFIDHVGRTVFTLTQTQPTQKKRPILLIPNSDSTQLIIIPSSGRLNSGIYDLKLTYHRDYEDETRSINHRYDRPVESAANDASPVEVHLKLRIL